MPIGARPYRDYYVWSDTDQKYREARDHLRRHESSNWTWDERAGQYYWHRFYSSQPDLNFDNPRVQDEMLNVARFWLDLGIDGFRVDAVPYLFEREGTNLREPARDACLPEGLAAFMDENYPGRILLCEANQWPEDVRPYFGDGDEFHMAFHFPLMPRIFMALRQGERRTNPLGDAAHAAHPRELPVVHLPAQSRRADPRDGHRGGAPVDVGGVCAGARHALEPGHPPAPGAPAG